MGDRQRPDGSFDLLCDMVEGCGAPVTHLDAKGYIYCRLHGQERKASQRCRQLTSAELAQLRRGEPLSKY